MWRQLSLNFGSGYPRVIHADDPPTSTILERVERHSAYLKALHISPVRIAQILTWPDAHWRKVIKVRNDKERICWVPAAYLYKVQQKLASHLGKYVGHDGPMVLPRVSQAYLPGSSIVRNAEAHQQNRSSWCIDLVGAFESITARHIERYLLRHFDFGGLSWRMSAAVSGSLTYEQYQEKSKYLRHLWRHDLAWIFSRLLTYRGRLRQGPPSSPCIFNALMNRFDEKVVEALGGEVPLLVSEEEDELPLWPVTRDQTLVVYTRYGDDLCFSSLAEEFPEDVKVKVKAVILAQGFEYNPKKIYLGRRGILEFPGVLIINGRRRPTGSYITHLAKQRETLTSTQRRGHRGFLNQFGKAGKLPVIQRLIGR